MRRWCLRRRPGRICADERGRRDGAGASAWRGSKERGAAVEGRGREGGRRGAKRGRLPRRPSSCPIIDGFCANQSERNRWRESTDRCVSFLPALSTGCPYLAPITTNALIIIPLPLPVRALLHPPLLGTFCAPSDVLFTRAHARRNLTDGHEQTRFLAAPGVQPW